MFCTHCGKQIADDAKFCTACGAPVAKITPRSDGPASGQEPATEPAAAPEAAPEQAEAPAVVDQTAGTETATDQAAEAEAMVDPAAEAAAPARAPETETAADQATEAEPALEAEPKSSGDASVAPTTQMAPETDTPEPPATPLETNQGDGTGPDASAAFDQQQTVFAPAPATPAAGFTGAQPAAAGFAPDQQPAPEQQAPAPQKPKRRRGLIAGIIILVLVLIAAAGVGALYALGIGPFARAEEPVQNEQLDTDDSSADDAPNEEQIEVPDLTGMDEHDAMNAIRSAGLAIGDIEEQHDAADEGTVIGQTPGAGDDADKGDEVDLVVSSGPETTIEHRYQVITEARTWSDAQAWCEANGGYLATVESADEYQHILDILPSSGTSVVWLGATRSGDTWQWVDGEPMSFTAWASGEPNNDGGNENRLVLLKSNGSWAWYDVPDDVSSVYSSDKLAFVMETEVEVPLS